MTSRRPVSRRTGVRIFLVDDHPIVRRGLQLLIGQEAGFEICGDADNGGDALERIVALAPDVAVVDLSLKGSHGLELIKQLRVQAPDVRILVFSMRPETVFAERALRAGAQGYLSKEDGAERVVDAIRSLLRGGTYLSDVIRDSMLARLAGTRAAEALAEDALSDRELEVLEALGSGLGTRAIADKLGVSVKTIDSHREHIKDKLGLQDAAELVKYAFHWLNDR